MWGLANVRVFTARLTGKWCPRQPGSEWNGRTGRWPTSSRRTTTASTIGGVSEPETSTAGGAGLRCWRASCGRTLRARSRAATSRCLHRALWGKVLRRWGCGTRGKMFSATSISLPTTRNMCGSVPRWMAFTSTASRAAALSTSLRRKRKREASATATAWTGRHLPPVGPLQREFVRHLQRQLVRRLYRPQSRRPARGGREVARVR
ncbi:unnamed protein product [Laminaria digitata]